MPPDAIPGRKPVAPGRLLIDTPLLRYAGSPA
jgi:hypothetical protein